MQREGQNNIHWDPLYSIVEESVPKSVLQNKNRAKSWAYGYDKKYNIVIISKDGTLGQVYDINGLKVGLPKQPKDIDSTHNKWVVKEFPKELSRIKTRQEWRMQDDKFKEKYIDDISEEFDRRENGYWFMNNGKPTYITGHNYMYLQHTKIDVGHPDYREANRIFFIYWEACKADDRCFGMIYLKIRRSGFSFMGSSIAVDTATLAKDARIGMLSKTGPDAKKLFTDKVVPININYPFYFKPLQAGMDRPKTAIEYSLPATKITKKNMNDVGKEEQEEGLDTSIDWKNTDDNSYDGEKLLYLLHDECYDPNTRILTEDMTFKPIKDIKIGDRVIVEGGKVKTVMKTAQGETDMYRVKQKWGKDYVVSRNHRLVLDQYKYRRNGKTTREEVIMTPPEYMALSKYAKQHTFSVKSRGLHFEDSEDITIPPYMLGLWLGDGSSNCGKIIVNHKEDPEVLAYLGRMAQMVNREFNVSKSDSRDAVYFRMHGFRTELRNLNLVNNKHIPAQYLRSSIETRLQILAGLIDSDGFVDKKKKCIVIGMSRPDLIEQIRVIASSCGLSCSSVRHSISNFGTDVYTINISGDLSIIPTIVERKRFEDYKPTYTNRRCGMDVEYIGKGEFYGIQVDGETDDERKLILEDFTISMNSSKWVKPLNILNNWRVTKTCLRVGRKVVGKCLMGSTCNALSKGGDNYKKLYMDSDPNERSANGQTRSGLYRLFIPMEWNFEGYIDEYGFPVFETPKKPVMGIDGEWIEQGAINFWNNEVESLKSDPDALNEFYRQFPRTEAHAFRDESKESLFNITKIYEQIDYNDATNVGKILTRGSFSWKDGKRFSEVVWSPDPRGRFLVSWLPPDSMRNKVLKRGDMYYPKHEEIGAFGCDSYDISGTVGGGASNGALHGVTRFNMTEAPSNEFFLEYVARPPMAEVFFEDVLMACWFYSMPILCENNKPRLLYHFKHAGMRGFSINRPDKPRNKLSKTEKELGGIPNSSEDVRQAHAACIESYINKYVGIDHTGDYREQGDIGSMFFNRTLEDWAKFEFNNRTKYDASISSGLALMAIQRFDMQPQREKSKINLNFVRYDNSGFQSKII